MWQAFQPALHQSHVRMYQPAPCHVSLCIIQTAAATRSLPHKQFPATLLLAATFLPPYNQFATSHGRLLSVLPDALRSCLGRLSLNHSIPA